MNDKLPKDAEGKSIPFDTECLYAYDGEKQDVFSFTYYREKDKWEIEADSLIIDSTRLYLNKPDSLEQLANDLDRMLSNFKGFVCAYFNACDKDCKECLVGIDDPKYTVRLLSYDVARRVHRLAGDAE